MKVRTIPTKEINKDNYNSTSVERAKRLKDSTSIDYFTDKRIAFTVLDFPKATKHSVIFDTTKKQPNDWKCTCKWASLKGKDGKYCAHILACNLMLNENNKKLD